MSKKLLVLPGDGISPEVIFSSVAVLKATTEELDIEFGDIGQVAYDKTEQYLPPETVDLATEADAIISGMVTKHQEMNYRDPLRVLKKQLHLYAIYRKFFPLCDELGTPGVDLILITSNPDSRLNIVEVENLNGVTSERYINTTSCRRVFNKAMQIAESKNRKKITCAHRSGIFPTSDGLFLNTFYQELAASEFLLQDGEVEVIASELVMDPSSMDVVISTDIYGSALAGVAAGMVGGTYLTPMGSLGDDIGLFEPMEGPKITMAADGFTNPTSAILSGAMALDQCKLTLDAEKVRKAVRSVYAKGHITPDVGGTCTTREFTRFVIEEVKKQK